MAKTSGPLFSVDAHGSLSGILTFSRRRSGSQVRSLNKPRGVPSHAQRSQRRLTEFLVAQWQGMTLADRDTWRARALAGGTTLSGYHYFLAQAHRDLLAHAGLVTYWPMNQIVNGYCNDLSGNGIHLKIGDPYPSAAPAIAASKNNRYDHCLDFSASGQQTATPKQELWQRGTGDFSLCFSVFDRNFDKYAVLFKSFTVISTVRGFLICADPAGSLQISIGNGYILMHGQPSPLPMSQWLDLVIVRKSGNVDLYRNGSHWRGPWGLWANMDSAEGIQVGCYPGVDSWTMDGKMDEVCFYDRAMPAAEVKARARFNGKI